MRLLGRWGFNKKEEGRRKKEEGKMPVLQENLSFVEQASCLLLKMVQNISLN